MQEFSKGKSQSVTISDGILESWTGGQSQGRFRLSEIDGADARKGAMGYEVRLHIWPKSTYSINFEDQGQAEALVAAIEAERAGTF